MVVLGMGLAQRWQVRHGLSLPQPPPPPGCRCHPPGPSVPSPRRVRLADRKAQRRIADGIFHHRIVAAQGLGAFREGGSSNLHEGQGLSSHPSFPHHSSLPREADSPGCSTALFITPFTLLLCSTSRSACTSSFFHPTLLFLTKKLCPLEFS